MPMYYLCRGAAMAAWLYSVLHVAHLSHRFEPRARRERRDYHFKRGLSSYLAGAYDQAAEEFHAVLKLDPLDADARFHLGMTLLARGETRAARKTFRRCLADDVSGKWRWEIETRLESIGKPS
jgi:TolA-binding protein